MSAKLCIVMHVYVINKIFYLLRNHLIQYMTIKDFYNKVCHMYHIISINLFEKRNSYHYFYPRENVDIYQIYILWKIWQIRPLFILNKICEYFEDKNGASRFKSFAAYVFFFSCNYLYINYQSAELTLHFQRSLMRYCLLLRSLHRLQDPQEYYVPNIKIEMYYYYLIDN